jgi:hypothetical protein
MLLVIIGLKISTWITGMEEDDLSLMMTLDVYKEKMTRS